MNGKIVGVGETFKLAVGDDDELVAVMVPPDSFKQGSNDVRVYSAREAPGYGRARPRFGSG